MQITLWPSNPNCGYASLKHTTATDKTHSYCAVHCNTICYSQRSQVTQIIINKDLLGQNGTVSKTTAWDTQVFGLAVNSLARLPAHHSESALVLWIWFLIPASWRYGSQEAEVMVGGIAWIPSCRILATEGILGLNQGMEAASFSLKDFLSTSEHTAEGARETEAVEKNLPKIHSERLNRSLCRSQQAPWKVKKHGPWYQKVFITERNV